MSNPQEIEKQNILNIVDRIDPKKQSDIYSLIETEYTNLVSQTTELSNYGETSKRQGSKGSNKIINIEKISNYINKNNKNIDIDKLSKAFSDDIISKQIKLNVNNIIISNMNSNRISSISYNPIDYIYTVISLFKTLEVNKFTNAVRYICFKNKLFKEYILAFDEREDNFLFRELRKNLGKLLCNKNIEINDVISFTLPDYDHIDLQNISNREEDPNKWIIITNVSIRLSDCLLEFMMLNAKFDMQLDLEIKYDWYEDKIQSVNLLDSSRITVPIIQIEPIFYIPMLLIPDLPVYDPYELAAYIILEPLIAVFVGIMNGVDGYNNLLKDFIDTSNYKDFALLYFVALFDPNLKPIK
jgi:hypothetical protein